jgi:uncharacterized protein YceK
MKTLLASLALALTLLPGCGTLCSMSLAMPDWKREPMAFSGVRLDGYLLSEGFFPMVLDVPVSLGIDVLLLPITGPQSIAVASRHGRAARDVTEDATVIRPSASREARRDERPFDAPRSYAVR